MENKEQLLFALDAADAGQWDEAHKRVQEGDGPFSYWIHANLHREEGNESNAGYWYQRAEKDPSILPVPEERRKIREALEGLGT